MLSLKITTLGDRCVGCAACMNVCQNHVVTMEVGADGFYAPSVDESLCIGCGKCDRTCPQLGNRSYENDPKPRCYALMASSEIRAKSSSGGAFTLLAEHILRGGGKVYGCAWDEGITARHVGITSLAELPRLRKSKYVESEMRYTYRQVERDLQDGYTVLFTGLPCHMAALKAYLGREYANLYLVDLVCHSIMPAGIFARYIREKEQALGKKVSHADFRDQSDGWEHSCSRLRLDFEDGSVYKPEQDPYFQGFSSSLLKKSACYDCNYCSFPRQGDLTIGDFWGIDKLRPELNDHKGLSMVCVNSAKGGELLESITPVCACLEEMDLASAVVFNRFSSGTIAEKTARKRDHFYALLDRYPVEEALHRALNGVYDIGLVGNWTTQNYGAHLTYYAFYRTLADMGHDVLMVTLPFGDKAPRARLFERQPYPAYTVEPGYADLSSMKELNKRCDTFVVGSDQLWNPALFGEQMGAAMLSFADSDKRKLSYATSFGVAELEAEGEHIAKMRYLMGRLQKRSVREESGVDICRDVLQADAEWVMDPVFLCDMKYYWELADRSSVDVSQPYPFFYTYLADRPKQDVLTQLAKRLDKKIVCIAEKYTWDWSLGEDEGRCLLFGQCTVEDWLRYLSHSSLVVTDSYHAYCFSILFRKQIVTIFANRHVAERARPLARRLGMKEPPLLGQFDMDTCLEIGTQDYDAVEKRLNEERVRSKSWLADALRAPVSYDKADLLWDAIGTDILDARQKERTQEISSNRLKYADRNIVIFGAGAVLYKYCEIIKNSISVQFVVANRPHKWNTVLYDSFLCQSPEKLLELENPYVLIASKDPDTINSIKQQLAAMGIKDVAPLSDWFQL